MIKKELFSIKLQAVLKEHGFKVSKENSWQLFKSIIEMMVDSCLEDDDNKIVLSGIGVFEIVKSAARGTKKGVVAFVPRLRWWASKRIIEYLELAFDQIPDPELRAIKRKQLEKLGKFRVNLPKKG